jgi:hypothetical protein
LYRSRWSAHGADSSITVYHRDNPSRPNDPWGIDDETSAAGNHCGCGPGWLREQRDPQSGFPDHAHDPHDDSDDEEASYHSQEAAGTHDSHHDGGACHYPRDDARYPRDDARSARDDAGSACDDAGGARAYLGRARESSSPVRGPGPEARTDAHADAHHAEVKWWRRRQDNAAGLLADAAGP